MKKESKLFLVLGIVVLMFSVLFMNGGKTSANELDVDLYSDLSEGEIVVDTFSELVVYDEVVREEMLFDEDEDNVITPFERRLKWYVMSSAYQGLSYGAWKYAGVSTLSGGVLSASHTKTVAHRYTGTLQVPLKTLKTAVGFDATKTWSKTVSYSTKAYISGRYRIEYRHVYKKYKVKQQKKYDRRTKAYDTKYVYPQRWVERQYRVVKF